MELGITETTTTETINLEESNIPIHNIGHLQNFYPIIHTNVKDTDIVIFTIQNIREFWKENKSLWFSQFPIKSLPIIYNVYKSCTEIDFALLLHYDQIYRHPCPLIPPQNKNLAFLFASKLALKLIHFDDYNTMEIWEKVFILLAIRHNNNLTLKYFVLKKVYRLLQIHPTDPLLLRFLKATILDIHTTKQTNGYTPLPYPNNNTYDEFKHLLVQPTINEHHNTKIFKQIALEFIPIFKLMEETTFAVSISGGVDSMVTSYIMDAICKQFKKKMILIHICYNNRDCCSDEIKMLLWWAKKLNVPLYVRIIDEIKRKRNNRYRELYESITRYIRFSVYEYFNCPIILGHNKDDCIENIFSNISKTIHYDNLMGMCNISIENNVCIIRPMLDIAKSTIIEFADNNNVPYLEDSTPSWSNRGQMRDVLIPQINKFNPNIIDGLIYFTKYTNFLYKQWFDNFKEWREKHITCESNNMIILRNKFFNDNYMTLNFWIQIWFSEVLISRPTNKSLINLIGCIDENKVRKITLNKYYDAIIDIDMIHIICSIEQE